MAETGTFDNAQYRVTIGPAHLQHRSELLAAQHCQSRRHTVAGCRTYQYWRQVDIEAAATRKRHFQQRYQQAAVRAVMIGEQQFALQQLLHQIEEGAQQFGSQASFADPRRSAA